MVCAEHGAKRFGADIGYDFGGAAVLAGAFRQLLRPGGWVWLADSVNIHRDDLLLALSTATPHGW